MSDFKCPFCGSESLLIETPFIKKSDIWPMEYKTEKTFCCKAQAKNAEYIDKHFHDRSEKPSLEEVAKE